METIVSRDTDIFREYLASLDSSDRTRSPFARLAATIKLSQLRRDLRRAGSTADGEVDDETAALLHQVDERLNRDALHRFEARPWGSRIMIFVLSVVVQQLAILAVLFATLLFVRLAPKPRWWNPLLPHEQPIFIYAFILIFFCAPPLIALAVVFGGRYFQAWKKTVPASLAILAIGLIGTLLAVRGKSEPAYQANHSSLARFAADRGIDQTSYDSWLESNWLFKDPKFRSDYEGFLRNGPGRWITSRFDSLEDSAWADTLPIFGEYIDGGQDMDSFRDWLSYYLERNRIYSEERTEGEVGALTGPANQRFLGVWQVEPYLKERDERIHSAYLGSIDRSARSWGLASLGFYAVIFVAAYLIAPISASFKRRFARTGRSSVTGNQISSVVPLSEQSYSFPEQRHIATPAFFNTPFKILSQVHRIFLRRAVLTSVVVFLFWAAVYGLDLTTSGAGPKSHAGFMQSYLLIGPSASSPGPQQNAAFVEVSSAAPDGELTLGKRVSKLEQRIDDSEYDVGKKLKDQGKAIDHQQRDISEIKTSVSQFDTVPGQITDLNTKTAAVESRTAQISGEIGAVKQQADTIDKNVTTKLGDIETKNNRTADQVGRVQEQASGLETRTEELEKELDRRAAQVEAQTQELGERTTALKEREEQSNQLQRVAFAAIVSGLKAETEDLDNRTQSVLQKLFFKGDAKRDAQALHRRGSELATELQKVDTEEAKNLLAQVNELLKHIETIAARLK